MHIPKEARKSILARVIDGRNEQVEWIRHADTVWIVADGQETVISPSAWKQAWADLQARGFVEVYPTNQAQMAENKKRVLDLIRRAFQDVILGEGIGLRQANGLDDYADAEALAAYRSQDEKTDWSAIPVEDLDCYYSSLSFFDAEGMRFHLPAYMTADLEGALSCADIVYHLVHFEVLGTSRFEKLTNLQRNTVREFLLLHLSDPNWDFDHPVIESALREYWTE